MPFRRLGPHLAYRADIIKWADRMEARSEFPHNGAYCIGGSALDGVSEANAVFASGLSRTSRSHLPIEVKTLLFDITVARLKSILRRIARVKSPEPICGADHDRVLKQADSPVVLRSLEDLGEPLIC